MPTQHLHQVPSNVGILTVVAPQRTNRPEGLRKPYEYVLTRKRAERLYKNLRDFLNPKDDTTWQHAYCSKRSLSKGIFLHLWALAYAPELMVGANDDTGISEDEWKKTAAEVQQKLTVALGPDAELYVEPYSKTDKFQFRFECYIAFKELL